MAVRRSSSRRVDSKVYLTLIYFSKCTVITNENLSVAETAGMTVMIIAVISTSVSFGCSLSGLSSSQGMFSLINQFQMYLLLPLVGADIHENVITFIEGMDIGLLNFPFIKADQIKYIKIVPEYLYAPQNNDYLISIGVISKSAFVNNTQILIIIGGILIIHILYIPLYKK